MTHDHSEWIRCHKLPEPCKTSMLNCGSIMEGCRACDAPPTGRYNVGHLSICISWMQGMRDGMHGGRDIDVLYRVDLQM